MKDINTAQRAIKESENPDVKKVVQIKSIPDRSIILNGFERVDYFDSYRAPVRSADPIDKITLLLFETQGWIGKLLAIRDGIAGFIGLKRVKRKNMPVEAGSDTRNAAMPFTVVDQNANEIVMEERDMHLTFRTSVFLDRKHESNNLYLSTVVQYHHFFGKIYFFLVKPFHILIVRSMLKHYAGQNNRER